MATRMKFGLSTLFALAMIGLGVAIYAGVSTQAEASDEKNHPATSTSSVYRMTDASAIDGTSSTLVRTKEGITATISTLELDPGSAYTAWWVIFNNPKKCEHPIPGITSCGEGDVFGMPLGDTPVKVSVQYAAGNVIGGTGMGNFGASLEEGELPTAPGQRVFGPGLLDSKKAEVHLVVRSHGEIIPEQEAAQISTFGGACTPNPTLPVWDRPAPTSAWMCNSPPICQRIKTTKIWQPARKRN